jgi:predicted TPR repeat methyltransferase
VGRRLLFGIGNAAMNRKQRRAQGKTIKPSGRAVPDAAALHEAGIQAYRAGELEQAAALIAQAIAFNGAIPSFHYNLGIVFKALGRMEQAAASYERAIALKLDYVDAHNNLGNIFKALGRHDRARASFQRALQHNPGNADTHYNLGILACDLERRDEAVAHLRNYLECDPADRRGARLLLAHLGAGEAPEHASQAQMFHIYDVRARFWDREAYFGAALAADGLNRHAGPERLDILDIGCGTGLVGERLRGLADRLDGVDLSPTMLEKAKAKGVYDQLYQGDLASFMNGHEARYDAVVAAATLIHFGDLNPLFQAAGRCLRDKGLFVFTLFPLEGSAVDFAVASDYRLAQNGCFQHSTAYVERLAAETGFAVRELENAVHERDSNGSPVAGLAAVLGRG